MAWRDESEWEKDWWGTCQNTYAEEAKQQVYAEKMGLKATALDGKYPVYDLEGASVLDIGGGPVSMLLKGVHYGDCLVADPCNYPSWINERYKEAGIGYLKKKGEDLELVGYDEVWIYNVLQHTDEPHKIARNALRAGKIVRVFEWIDTYVSKGHPHVLTEKHLNKWFKGEGRVETLNDRGCRGKAWYGVFKGV